MSELKGACIIGQSGGPTSVINASAYGVIRTALDSDCITAVYGAEHGIKGVLADRLFDMSKEDARELELLKYTPSSALGSCRYKIADPDVDDTDYKRILEVFKKHEMCIRDRLVECGFLSNAEEAARLCETDYQRKLAVTVAAGFLAGLAGGQAAA